MAYLIDSSTDDRTLHASMHGLMSRVDFDYFRDQARNAYSNLGSFASSYIDRTRELFDNFDLGALRDGVNAVRDRFGKRWDEDRIRPLYDLVDLQQAKSQMRSLLMVNPRARRLYYEDKISGFNGDFHDEQPNVVEGREQNAYRNIMQGAYVGTEDEDRFVTYLDVLEDPDSVADFIYSHDERMIIRNAWEVFEQALDDGLQDPSSPHKNLL